MSAQRWDEEQIFEVALEKKTPEELAVFLDETCTGDRELRERVEALLKSHSDAGSFLQKPAAAPSSPETDDEDEPLTPKSDPAAAPRAGQTLVTGSVELFLKNLKASGLVSSADLQSHMVEINSAAGDSQNDVAAKLVKKNVLTAYQAEQLLAGHGEDCTLGGRYQLLEQIGSGGMGIVFRALDTQLDRIVAIKVMSPHNLSDPDAVSRFKREARALAQLALPNVVQAFDSGEDHGRNFLVMEYVQGVGLSDLVKQKGPIPPTVAADYVYQVAIGMQSAHERGMIHRDIKPANMILGSNGQIKILDLGLAKFLQDQLPDSEATRDNIGMGTPDYMAPEQFRDARTVDHRADIYSLGGTLYYLIAVQVPFPGSSLSEKAHAHETKQPISLDEHCPQVPAGLTLAAERMMAKRPADRYQKMHDVADALAPYVAGSSPSLPSVRNTVSFLNSQNVRSHQRAGLMAWIAGGAVVVATIALLALFLPSFFDASSPENGNIAGLDGKTSVAKTVSIPNQKSAKTQPVGSGNPSAKTPNRPDSVSAVLTVSMDPKIPGEYPSINAAMKAVKPGQTIRILDAGPYREQITFDRRHNGVTLESTGNAIFELATPTDMIQIENALDVTIRKLHFRVTSTKPGDLLPQPPLLVRVHGDCPGLLVQGLEADATPAGTYAGVHIAAGFSSDPNRPIVIQKCVLRRAMVGIYLDGELGTVERTIVRNNVIDAPAHTGIHIFGLVKNVQIVGNRLLSAQQVSVIISDLGQTSENLLVANNSIWRSKIGLAVSAKEPTGKNVRIQNNLFLDSRSFDMLFVDGLSAKPGTPLTARDGELLLKHWKFGQNWREGRRPPEETARKNGWIPPSDDDKFLDKIDGISRDTNDPPSFLRPDAKSKLATEGAGKTDPSLPSYIGARPPKGARVELGSHVAHAAGQTPRADGFSGRKRPCELRFDQRRPEGRQTLGYNSRLGQCCVQRDDSAGSKEPV